MLYHVFEAGADDAYALYVNADKAAFDANVQKALDLLTPDDIAAGTVEADTVEDAVRRVATGAWQYSQKF